MPTGSCCSKTCAGSRHGSAVLVLRYFDDLTEAVTATALGIPVVTVESHAREALARLRHQRWDEEQSAAAT